VSAPRPSQPIFSDDRQSGATANEVQRRTRQDQA
jgi:hypothetical protein